jgi:hypothetical protein
VLVAWVIGADLAPIQERTAPVCPGFPLIVGPGPNLGADSRIVRHKTTSSGLKFTASAHGCLSTRGASMFICAQTAAICSRASIMTYIHGCWKHVSLIGARLVRVPKSPNHVNICFQLSRTRARRFLGIAASLTQSNRLELQHQCRVPCVLAVIPRLRPPQLKLRLYHSPFQ